MLLVEFSQTILPMFLSPALHFIVVRKVVCYLYNYEIYITCSMFVPQKMIFLYFYIASALPDRRIFSNIINKISLSNEPDPALLLERKEGLEHYLQVQG